MYMLSILTMDCSVYTTPEMKGEWEYSVSFLSVGEYTSTLLVVVIGYSEPSTVAVSPARVLG
jgi:hypothetical protein